MSRQLVQAIAEMREEEALRLVHSALETGEDPNAILSVCQEAMAIVGSRYEKGEYFLPELMMSGEVLRKISELVRPNLAVEGRDGGQLGKVVIGTVRGDIHDIGKDIVVFMLRVSGFDVLDLGVDVSEARFVQAVKEFRPQVVGLSGLLTIAYGSMKKTVDALREAELRDQVKIMIGGAQINDTVCSYAQADGFGSDAMLAVALSKRWVGV